MTLPLAIADALRFEHRGNRSYDEQDPSHIVHPNGSLIASYDRAFLAAAMRHVLDAYGVSITHSQEAAA